MELIALFQAQPGTYLSGEWLSRKLGCSRTAVWKRIRQLERQGYRFEAAPRRGYRLVGEPDRIAAADIQARLRTRAWGRSLVLLERVDSTQTAAHERIARGAAEGTLIIAEEQTAGRGRMKRKWHSPPGKGIWMSLVLKPRVPLRFLPQMTLLFSVAVCRAIRRVSGAEAEIKWPNDIFVGGKKVCGLLLESNAEDERLVHVVAGIGISANLLADDYPPELRETATSLRIETGRQVPRSELIAETMNELETLYDLYLEQGFEPIRSLWEALSFTLGRAVRVRGSEGWIEGTAVGLDRMGALLVRLPDGRTMPVYSGDLQDAVPCRHGNDVES